jgi:hypothetical protein
MPAETGGQKPRCAAFDADLRGWESHREPEEAEKASPSQEVRQAEVLDAAAQIFREKGYHEASIVEIAERAGVVEVPSIVISRPRENCW